MRTLLKGQPEAVETDRIYLLEKMTDPVQRKQTTK